MSLTADEIRQRKPKTRRVSVPEWANGDPDAAHIHVRVMSGRGVAEVSRALETFQQSKAEADVIEAFATAVRFGACDDAGHLLFRDTEVADLLEDLEWTALRRVGDAAMDISGIGAGAVDEAEKNSDGDRTSSGGIDSPAT